LPLCGFIFVQQNSGLHEYLSGTPTARISNAVSGYSRFVISKEDQAASTWVSTKMPPTSFLQADFSALLGSVQNGKIPVTRQIPQIAPYGLLENSYVFLSTANLKSGIASCPASDRTIVNFAVPVDYLDDNLSLVYSTGGSRVYR
jgi:hypothetical protein